ncbi:MAG: GLPGLI family protein [Ginsengibacter sp.]
MKKISVVMVICVALTARAQQKEGKVIYSRIIQMQIQVDDNDHMQQMMPKSHTDKFELTFGNNQSLWKHIDEADYADDMDGRSMQINVITPGQSDIVFNDFDVAKTIEQRDFMDKKFIVTDSTHRLNWKLTGETKTILGHVCQEAIAQRAGKRMQMNIDNGKMERKELEDTTNIIAWFTTDIPVPAGPEVQGQLPGLILALDINKGRMVYQALEIQATADLTAIKAPAKGKKVTPEEFIKERDKLIEEMQRNNQGSGNRVIRIQN